MTLRSLIRQLREKRWKYAPLIEISISRENLLHNLKVFKKIFSKSLIAPVLKSNAYGHGLVEVASILDSEELPFFVVDSYHEALILRNEGIGTPILVIGYTQTENISRNRLKNIIFTITSFDQIKNLSKLTKPAQFHLKIDTGMGRQGIKEKDLHQAIQLIKENPNIDLLGAATHLADADNLNQVYTKEQIVRWDAILEEVRKQFPKMRFFHASNSAGYYYENTIDGDVARVGLGLYGIHPNIKRDYKLPLKPVLEMKSIITGMKTLERGEKIGYNGTFEAKDRMTIATIPAGYTEGIDRRLSNTGFVKIKNEFCPIVGRVSMNISTVDVSKVPGLMLEDEVILISRNQDDKNSIQNMAHFGDVIPYELLAHIPEGIRRKVV